MINPTISDNLSLFCDENLKFPYICSKTDSISSKANLTSGVSLVPKLITVLKWLSHL